ncbi:MAG: hypothetical protein OXK77_12610 [Gemmatimonadota bacterium]|nr:hypothetical protein [Gemmatimonadota bacterium]MDE2864093.1 hypothetical protein [Gemmatimonadota bacterium]
MAVTITGAELEAVIGAERAVAERLLSVATAVVERYAPDAPSDIQNEAVIRFAGYLHQSRATIAFRSTSIGGIDVQGPPTHAPAFRNCGAMALLSPWKVRRAGVI